MKRIGVLTSGGDGPGMNAAIRAVVRSASSHDMEVVAYRDGYAGLMAGWTVPLNDRAVGGQIQRGGTFIGTSRAPAFREPEGRKQAAEQLERDGADALVVIGGEGSFKGALALQQEFGTSIVGIPGTIDNDVYGTDETIGFDTAVNTAMQAIDRVRDTSEATGMTFFVEVMGRTCGALAIQAALSGGAAGVLVPEEHNEAEKLAEQLRVSIERGKRSHVVIVAEGDELGGAFKTAERVAGLVSVPYRVVVLGHIQRGGSPTARDRIIASMMGAQAVDALAGGRTALMAGMWRGEVREVPLAEVVKHTHGEIRMDMLHLAQRLSG
jgi:6-phosphofructokinase 1